MIIIQKGDLYILPITITSGGEPVTPESVDDVRIKIDDILKEYSKNQLSFDTETNQWGYQLTQEQTHQIKDKTILILIGIKKDDDFIYTPTSKIKVGQSIITEDW